MLYYSTVCTLEMLVVTIQRCKYSKTPMSYLDSTNISITVNIDNVNDPPGSTTM